MRLLAWGEFLAGAGLTARRLTSERERGTLALAMGSAESYQMLAHTEVDCAAVVLCDQLAKTFEKKQAAQIVRVHFPTWGRCVAHAEHSDVDQYFAIVETVRVSDGATAHLTCGST